MASEAPVDPSLGASNAAPATPSKTAASGASDDMAAGLMRFLEPILLETDEHIKNVVSSQNSLSNQIDDLQEGAFWWAQGANLRISSFDELFLCLLASTTDEMVHVSLQKCENLPRLARFRHWHPTCRS